MNKSLDSFLKTNRPHAPAAPGDELSQLRHSIRSQPRPSRWFDWHWAVPGLVAAGLFGLFIIPSSQLISTNSGESAQHLEVFLDETVGSFYGGNGISNVDIQIGSEWIQLTEI